MARKFRRPPVARDKRLKRPLHSDSGPPERWQHSSRSIEFTEHAGVFAARSLQEHVLDRLLALRLVSRRAVGAGLKLHRDYHIARVEKAITASFSPVGVQASDPHRCFDRNKVQEAAYQRWRLALKQLPPASRDVAIHVACIGCWPSLEQIGKLREGLNRLAKYYGLDF